MYLYLCNYLSIFLSIYPFIYPSIYLSIYLSIFRRIHSVNWHYSEFNAQKSKPYIGTGQSLYPSIYLSIYLSFYLSIYLSIFRRTVWTGITVSITSRKVSPTSALAPPRLNQVKCIFFHNSLPLYSVHERCTWTYTNCNESWNKL